MRGNWKEGVDLDLELSEVANNEEYHYPQW